MEVDITEFKVCIDEHEPYLDEVDGNSMFFLKCGYYFSLC